MARGKPAVWHTATSGDTSLSVLARGILDKLRLKVPDLSPELFLAIEGGRGPETEAGESDRADSLAAELSRELEARLTRHLYLVLDDMHVLSRRGDGARLVAALSRNAPGHFHVITASRDALPFPTSRMRVQGHASEITADLLAFTIDEVASLLGQAGEESPQAAERIFDRTGGWPVAVVLAMQLEHLGAEGVSSGVDGKATLFEYLAEEVIGSESTASLDALRAAALVPWITSEMAASLGIGEGAANWFDPHRRSVYLTPAPNHTGAVSLSPLVRDFILERHPLGREESDALLLSASARYEQEGALAEAMDCLSRHGSADEIARLVSERGESLLAAGLARQMVATIGQIPRDRRDVEIRLFEAEARQVLGDWEGATACYEDLVPGPGEIPARVAWRLGFLSHMRGDVKSALDVYRAGGGAKVTWPTKLPCSVGRLALTGYAVSVTRPSPWPTRRWRWPVRRTTQARWPRPTPCLPWWRRWMGTGPGTTYPTCGRWSTPSGRATWYRRSGSAQSGFALPRGGDYANALAELDMALRLADMTGFQLWRAMSLSNRAQVLAGLGRLEESVADLEQSREIFRGMGSMLESYPLAQMADVYALRGDFALARAGYEEAIRLGDEAQDLQALVPALSGLARLIASDDPGRASAWRTGAAEVASVIGHVRALLAQGFVALSAGSSELARAKAVEAADVPRSRQDLPGLAEAIELEAATLIDETRAAIAIRAGPPRVGGDRRAHRAGQGRYGVVRPARWRFRSRRGIGGDLAPVGGEGPRPRGEKGRREPLGGASHDVIIRTLGGFGVTIAGEPVPSSAWQSRVAREVVEM